MKYKHFYSHLVESTELTLEIGELEIYKEERVHLISLFEANIHTYVVKEVLDQLPKEDKKIFLKNILEGNHKKTWKHLNERIKEAQDKINSSIKKIKIELIADVQAAKKSNKKSKS